MRETSGGAGFLNKTLTIFAFVKRGLPAERNGFNRDDAIDLGIARAVHDAHGSAPDFGFELVTAQGLVVQSSH
jgi:hypothetical protein